MPNKRPRPSKVQSWYQVRALLVDTGNASNTGSDPETLVAFTIPANTLDIPGTALKIVFGYDADGGAAAPGDYLRMNLGSAVLYELDLTTVASFTLGIAEIDVFRVDDVGDGQMLKNCRYTFGTSAGILLQEAVDEDPTTDLVLSLSVKLAAGIASYNGLSVYRYPSP